MHNIKKTIQLFSFFIIISSLFSVSFIVPAEYTFQTLEPITQITSDDTVEYRAVIVALGEGLIYSIPQMNGFITTLKNGGNWQDKNIHTLTNSRAEEQDIYNELQWLNESADDNDVSLFYFIGHGGSIQVNEYILAYDDPIYDYELDAYLEPIKGTVIVFIDACYSGGFIKELQNPNTIVMTACARDEPTYQVHDLKSGIFGYFLNMSISWLTKNVETSYIYTKIFTYMYSKQLNNTYSDVNIVHPQFYDGTSGATKLISHHAYVKNIIQFIKNLSFDGKTMYWRM